VTQSTAVTRPRTPVADIFEEAFRLYRRSFPRMVVVFGIFEIPLGVVTLPLTLAQAQWSRQWATTPVDLDMLGPLIGGTLLFWLVAALLWTFAAAGVTYLAGRSRTGASPSIPEALRELRRLAPSILGYVALLAAGSLVVLVLLAMVALVAVAMVDLRSSAGIAIVVVSIFLFSVASVVVLGFIVTRLTLAVPVLVLEGERPTGAIRRSWLLVRGSTWRTLGILFLASAVVGVIGLVVSPAYVPGVFEGLMSGSVGSYALVAIVSGALRTLVGPIVPVLMTVLYFEYSQRLGALPGIPYPESTATMP
jgi:hypothetical protein